MPRSESAGALHEGGRVSMFRSGSAGALSREARQTNAVAKVPPLRSETASGLREDSRSSIAATRATMSSVCSLRGTRNERVRPGSQVAQEGARHQIRRCRDLYDTSWRSANSGAIVSASGLTSAGSAARGIAARDAVIKGRRGCHSRGLDSLDPIVGVSIDIVKRADGPPAGTSINSLSRGQGVGSSSSSSPANAGDAATCTDQAASAVCAAAGAANGPATATLQGATTLSANAGSSDRAAGQQASASSRGSEDLWELADRLGMLSGFLSGSLLWDGGALLRAVVQGRLPALPPAHTRALSPPRSQSPLRGAALEGDFGVAPQPPGLALPGSVTRVPSTRQRSPSPAGQVSSYDLQVRGSAYGGAAPSAVASRPAGMVSNLQEVPLPAIQEPPLQIVPLSDWLSDVTAGLLRTTSQALPSRVGDVLANDEFQKLLESSPVDPVKLAIRGRSLTREQCEKASRPRLGQTWKQQTLEMAGNWQAPIGGNSGTSEDLLIWQIRLAKRHARKRHPEYGRPASVPPLNMQPEPEMQFVRGKVPDEMDTLWESSSTGSTTTPHNSSVSSSGFSGSGLTGRLQAGSAGSAASALPPGHPRVNLASSASGAASAFSSSGTSGFSSKGALEARGPGAPSTASDQVVFGSSPSKFDDEFSSQHSLRSGQRAVTHPITAAERAAIEADRDADSFGEEEAPPRRSSTMSDLPTGKEAQSNLRFAGMDQDDVAVPPETAAAAAEMNRRESILHEEQMAAKARARKKRATIRSAFSMKTSGGEEDESEEVSQDALGASAETPLQESSTESQKPAPWKKGDPLFRIKSRDSKVLALGKLGMSHTDLDVTSEASSEHHFVKSLLPPPSLQERDRGSVSAFSRQTTNQTEESEEPPETRIAAGASEPHPCGGVLGCLAQEFRQCLEEAGFFTVQEKCPVKDGYKESSKRMEALKQDLENLPSMPTTSEADNDTDFQVSLMTGHWKHRAEAVQEDKEQAMYEAHLDMRKQRYSKRLQAWSSKIVSKSYDPALWSRKAELCRFKLRGLTALGAYTDFMGQQQQRASSAPAQAKRPPSAAVAA